MQPPSNIWPEVTNSRQVDTLRSLYVLFPMSMIPARGEDYLEGNCAEVQAYRVRIRTQLVSSGLAQLLTVDWNAINQVQSTEQAARIGEIFRTAIADLHQPQKVAEFLVENLGWLLDGSAERVLQDRWRAPSDRFNPVFGFFIFMFCVATPIMVCGSLISLYWRSVPEMVSTLTGLVIGITPMVLAVLWMGTAVQRRYVYINRYYSVNAQWYINLTELYLYLRQEWCGR